MEVLDTEKVKVLLQAMIKLLDNGSAACRVSHPELSAFLRAVWQPADAFRVRPQVADGIGIPDPNPAECSKLVFLLEFS